MPNLILCAKPSSSSSSSSSCSVLLVRNRSMSYIKTGNSKRVMDTSLKSSSHGELTQGLNSKTNNESDEIETDTNQKTESRVVQTTTFASANDEELLLAAKHFLNGPTEEVDVDGDDIALQMTEGGVNNHVRYCERNGVRIGVVRLYNNGKETKRVQFEHRVLEVLHEHFAVADDCAFKIPKAKKDVDGNSYVVLPSGDCASVFELIEGKLPKTRFASAVGEATAQMSKRLQKAEKEVRETHPVSPTTVYRDIFGAFKKKGGSKERFYLECETNEGLDKVRPHVDRLLAQIRELEKTLEEIEEKGGLPSSLIHGDVHYDNCLACFDTGKVTGIIDFEFASYDWRMMEAAAGLSKYVGEKDPTAYVEDYIKGFCRASAPLTEQEIEYLPDLVKLRVLETVVYFVARSWAKEDDISQLALRAENYAARVDWIAVNAPFIKSAMREALSLSSSSSSSSSSR